MISKAWGERIAALMCIALALYFGSIALRFPAGGHMFPLFAAGMTILLALLMIASTFFDLPRLRGSFDLDFSFGQMKPVYVTLIVIAYVLLIFRLGYFVSSALFLVFTTLFVGIRNLKMILLTAIVLFPLMYLFFEGFLQANLPRGIAL
jgi:putative tricarboxylic transport membrane protein